MMSRHTRGRWAVAIVAAALLIALSGCGSSSSSSSAKSSSSAGESVASFQAKVAKYYKGTYTQPPSSAPKAPAGKNVWLISAGQAETVVSNDIQGASDAAKMLGWKPTIFDGKFEPNRYAEGIREAIANKADGIVMVLIDCDLVKGPLQQARAAGIKVVGVEAFDCNETSPGAQSLFSASLPYVEGTYNNWIENYGRAQADWLIAHTNGKASVVYPKTDEVKGFTVIREGAEKELAKCSGCEFHTYNFRQTDLGPQVRTETQQALLRYPNANSIILPYDSLVTGGVAAAISSSGRKITVVGAEGESANIEIIRKGEVGDSAGVGIPTRYEGFGGIDTLLRVFVGQKPVSEGIGLQLFDREHNLPPAGSTYEPPVAFEAAYEKAWGVSK
jgi:ribose transport system substrate-binding protein